MLLFLLLLLSLLLLFMMLSSLFRLLFSLLLVMLLLLLLLLQLAVRPALVPFVKMFSLLLMLSLFLLFMMLLLLSLLLFMMLSSLFRLLFLLLLVMLLLLLLQLAVRPALVPFVKMFFDQFGYFSPMTIAIYHVRLVEFTPQSTPHGSFPYPLRSPLSPVSVSSSPPPKQTNKHQTRTASNALSFTALPVLHIFLWFSSMGMMEGLDYDDVIRRLKTFYWSSLKACWTMWPLVMVRWAGNHVPLSPCPCLIPRPALSLLSTQSVAMHMPSTCPRSQPLGLPRES